MKITKYIQSDTVTYHPNKKIHPYINYYIPTNFNTEKPIFEIDTDYDNCFVILYTPTLTGVRNYLFCQYYKSFTGNDLNKAINIINVIPSRMFIFENSYDIYDPIEVVGGVQKKHLIHDYSKKL